MNGAVGNFNAHVAAHPGIDWEAFARQVVEQRLGLTFNPYTIQIEPHDSMAELFDAIARTNTILIDWARDVWGYISLGYFRQRLKEGEVGSSTMPHKVNPIDFENAEGNFGLANALLRLYGGVTADQPLPARPDRLDRAAQHGRGLRLHAAGHRQPAAQHGFEVNRAALAADLDASWEVLAEAVQTVMRRHGLANPQQLKGADAGQGHHPRDAAPLHRDARPARRREGAPACADARDLHRQGRRAGAAHRQLTRPVGDRLRLAAGRCARHDSMLCVGLDPEPAKFPPA